MLDRASGERAPQDDLQTEPPEPGTGGCRSNAEAPGRGRHRKAVLEPAILLWLLSEDVHGYELIERVHDLVAGEVRVDRGSTYRMLRSMERRRPGRLDLDHHGTGTQPQDVRHHLRGSLCAGARGGGLRRRARTLEALAAEAEDGLRRSALDTQPTRGGPKTKE